ncbi:MAG: ChrR family anti-sigma-E factor [Cypionkella sp.]|nr:ChrR family anti-sigma-E factor [Cypionkella sp.]
MTINHHLNDDLLMAYAAGTLPEAFSLAAATHISLCDDCRAALAAQEALGGAVLNMQGEAVMNAGALDAVLARLDAAPPTPPAKQHARHPVLPSPLLDYVGGDLASVKWRPLGMGVRQAILTTRDRGASARLLYIPAGQAVPDHGHRGMELTLVLQGAFRDETQRFARGDIEIAGEADEHTPVAEAGMDCICLAVTDAPLRFKGMIPRLMQPVFRI